MAMHAVFVGFDDPTTRACARASEDVVAPLMRANSRASEHTSVANAQNSTRSPSPSSDRVAIASNGEMRMANHRERVGLRAALFASNAREDEGYDDVSDAERDERDERDECQAHSSDESEQEAYDGARARAKMMFAARERRARTSSSARDVERDGDERAEASGEANESPTRSCPIDIPCAAKRAHWRTYVVEATEASAGDRRRRAGDRAL